MAPNVTAMTAFAGSLGRLITHTNSGSGGASTTLTTVTTGVISLTWTQMSAPLWQLPPVLPPVPGSLGVTLMDKGSFELPGLLGSPGLVPLGSLPPGSPPLGSPMPLLAPPPPPSSPPPPPSSPSSSSSQSQNNKPDGSVLLFGLVAYPYWFQPEPAGSGESQRPCWDPCNSRFGVSYMYIGNPSATISTAPPAFNALSGVTVSNVNVSPNSFTYSCSGCTGSATTPGSVVSNSTSWPIPSETPYKVAFRAFVAAAIAHFSPAASGGVVQPTQVGYVRVGYARGGEALPECTQDWPGYMNQALSEQNWLNFYADTSGYIMGQTELYALSPWAHAPRGRRATSLLPSAPVSSISSTIWSARAQGATPWGRARATAAMPPP